MLKKENRKAVLNDNGPLMGFLRMMVNSFFFIFILFIRICWHHEHCICSISKRLILTTDTQLDDAFMKLESFSYGGKELNKKQERM